MSDDTVKRAIDQRTDDAFARSVWQDPRAEYRLLLRRLKEKDAAAFDGAVREYESSVASRLVDPAVDPVRAWLGYGVRLAGWLGAGGRTVEIDADGRATTLLAAEPGLEPALLLHLPANEGGRAILVALPRQASPAQRATLALLAEGRLAL